MKRNTRRVWIPLIPAFFLPYPSFLHLSLFLSFTHGYYVLCIFSYIFPLIFPRYTFFFTYFLSFFTSLFLFNFFFLFLVANRESLFYRSTSCIPLFRTVAVFLAKTSQRAFLLSNYFAQSFVVHVIRIRLAVMSAINRMNQ